MDFLPLSSTINAEIYCETFKKLCCAIQSKWHSIVISGLVLIYENTCLHTDPATKIISRPSARNNLIIPSTAHISHQIIFKCPNIWNPSLLASRFHKNEVKQKSLICIIDGSFLQIRDTITWCLAMAKIMSKSRVYPLEIKLVWKFILVFY